MKMLFVGLLAVERVERLCWQVMGVMAGVWSYVRCCMGVSVGGRGWCGACQVYVAASVGGSQETESGAGVLINMWCVCPTQPGLQPPL